MDRRRVDVAIIGGGTAGLNARRAVERAGREPLLIERGPWGTTCARVGCMPSKLLIAAADAAHGVRQAGLFGIGADGPRPDPVAVPERVRRERDRFVGSVLRDVEALPRAQRLEGEARFLAPTRLEVAAASGAGDGKVEVEAGAIVVATGSSPVLPPPFDRPSPHILTTDQIFELPTLPRSLAVIGTGVIGLELGQAFTRLGVEVTLFSPFEALGLASDPLVVEAVHERLGTELDLELGYRPLELASAEEGVRLRWQSAGGEQRERGFEKVLVAAGRRPNLAHLDLERAGLRMGPDGRPPWDPRTTQWGDAPVFVAGDASGHRAVLHEAADEGRIAGTNAATWPEVTAHVRRTPLAIVFTDPQMAIAGAAWRELDADAVEAGTASFANQGRARVMGAGHGLLRVYATREGCRLVGAELFAPRAEHMAHWLASAIAQGLSVHALLERPFYHPTLEEGLRSALIDLARRLRVTGSCRPEDLAEAPGA